MFTRSSLAILALLFLSAKAFAGDIAVIAGFAPKSLTPTASSAAAYVTLSNKGVADRLLSVTSPAASMAMIHESKIVDGVATMDMRASVDVPAGGTVEMSPGGLHVMLMGLATPLKEGDQLALELTFEKAGVLQVTVPVTGLKGPEASTQ